MKDTRYMLAPGVQVREEDFGLLFYRMKGPRLYFLSSGRLLDASFFRGELTLEEQARQKGKQHISEMKKALDQLREKGVIIER